MATRRFTLYGSNPDQLAAQQYRYDAMGLGAAESNRAAAMNAQAQSIANAERVRQEDEAAMVRDRNERLAYLKLFADEAATRRGMMEDSRRFDASMGLSERQLAAQIARDKTTDGRALRKTYFDAAMDNAAEGLYTDVASVLRDNPMLRPDEAATVAATSQQMRKQIAPDIEKDRNAVAALNRRYDLIGLIDRAEKELKSTPQYTGMWPFRSESPGYRETLTAKELLEKEKAELDTRASQLEKNQRLIDRIGFPGEDGYYPVPRMPWESRVAPAATGAAKRRLRYNPQTGQIE